MKTIRELLGLRRSQRCTLGLEAATITGDRCDFGTALEPFREAFGSPIRQKIDDTVQVQIDPNGSAFAARPTIDSQVANRDKGFRRFLANAAQNCVVAGGDGQSSEQSLAWKTARDIADQPHDFRRSLGLTAVDARYTGKPLTEDLARTRGVPSAKPVDRRPYLR